MSESTDKQCDHSKMCRVCCRPCAVDAEIKRHIEMIDRAAIWNHRKFGGFKPWSAENVAEFAEEQIRLLGQPVGSAEKEVCRRCGLPDYYGIHDTFLHGCIKAHHFEKKENREV